MEVYRALLPDGKSYIGFTTQTLEIRQIEHELAAAKGSHLKFHEGIRKFGRHSIKWQSLQKVYSKKEGYVLERHFIKKFNSHKDGYNTTPSGRGSGFKAGKDHPMFGRPSPKRGTAITEVQRQKIKNAWDISKRKEFSVRKGGQPFKVFSETGIILGTWLVQNECARSLNIPCSGINKCLKGINKTCKGFRFEYV